MLAESFLELLVQNVPTVLLVSFTVYFLQNRYKRGLNKYPGPFIASLTDWWRFWDVAKRRPELTHIKLHEKYGDVVRLGPNLLSFSDPKVLKSIYGLNKGFTKSEFYPVQQAVARGHRLPSLFSTTDESFHASLRRCVNSTFSMSTLIQYEPFVDSTTELFLTQTETLYASTKKACNLSRWLQFYAFDVIGEMTYSKRHGFLEENRDIDGIIDYVAWFFDYAGPIGQIPFLDLLLLKNPIYLLASQWGLTDATFPVARFAQARMSERLTPSKPLLPTSTPPVQKDLLSKFLAAQTAHPDTMTSSLVTTMAISMAFAGSETTAITLSAIFYHLLKNPSILETLLKEIDEKARDGGFSDYKAGIVTWAEAQGMPYLDAVVKEAFRVHPAPGLLMERVVPTGGAEIGGKWVEGGTLVGCSAWVIHRRKEAFGEDVEAFRPERWLVDQTKDKEVEEQRIREMGGCLVHFGMGARTCIGRNISLLEVYKLVPSVLRRFEVNLQHPEKEWKLHNAWFVRQLEFNTVFERRKLLQPASTEV